MSTLTQFTSFREREIGEILPFPNTIAGNAAAWADGFLKCDGSVVPQATYPELYSKIGLIKSYGNWYPINTGFVARTALYGVGRYYTGNASSSSPTSGYETSATSISGRGGIFVPETGLFVVVPGNLVVYRSTNALNWSSVSVGSAALYTMAYGAGVYVHAGLSGILRSSTNAINWTARTSGTSTSITSMTYGAGRFIGFTETIQGLSRLNRPSGMLSSTNGINWTVTGAPLGGGCVDEWSRMSYTNGRFIGGIVPVPTADPGMKEFFPYSTIITSTNGVNWTRGIHDFVLVTMAGPVWDGDMYVTYGYGSEQPSSAEFDRILITSTNAINWRATKVPTDMPGPPQTYGTPALTPEGILTPFGFAYKYDYNTATEFALPQPIKNHLGFSYYIKAKSSAVTFELGI
jgi:hypothetical protein